MAPWTHRYSGNWHFQYLSGIQGVFDDSFFIWSSSGQIAMTWTIHVDDIIVLAKLEFLVWAVKLMEQRFGKIKRSGLPFTHMGMTTE